MNCKACKMEVGLRDRQLGCITELQEMMEDLQEGFVSAMTELSKIQDEDRMLHYKVETSKKEQQQQIKDIVLMVHALKTQFETIQSQINQASECQHMLETQILLLQKERAALLRDGQIVVDETMPLATTSRTESGRCPYCHRRPPGSPVPPPSHSSPDSRSDRYLSPLLKSFIASLPGPGESHEECHSDLDYQPPVVVMRKKSLASPCIARSISQTSHHRTSSADSDGMSHTSSRSGSSKGQARIPESTRKASSSARIPESTRKASSSADTVTKQANRCRIAREIVESERNYCATLGTVIQHYHEPMKAEGPVSATDCQLIFPSSLQRIYEYHCTMLRTLEERMATWKNRDVIGDIFARFTEAHEQQSTGAGYREYIENFPAAVAAVNRLEKQSDRFRKCMKKCDLKSPAKHGLVSLLMFPVRRIPNYVLMLQQLLKYTEANHPDEFYIPSCLSKFSDILKAMDSAVEQSLHSTIAPSDRRTKTLSLYISRSRASCESSDAEEIDEEDRKASSTTTKDSGNYSCNGDEGPETIVMTISTADERRVENGSRGYQDGALTLPRSFVKKNQSFADSSHGGTLGKSKPRGGLHEKSRATAEKANSAQPQNWTLPRDPVSTLLKRSKSQTELLQPQFETNVTVSSSTGPTTDVSTSRLHRARSCLSSEARLLASQGDAEIPADYAKDQHLTPAASERGCQQNQGHESPLKYSCRDKVSFHSQPDLLLYDNPTVLASASSHVPQSYEEGQLKRRSLGKSLKSLFSRKRSPLRADASRECAAEPYEGATPTTPPLSAYSAPFFKPPKMFAADGNASDDAADSDLVDMHDGIDSGLHLDLNTYEDENGEPYSAV